MNIAELRAAIAANNEKISGIHESSLRSDDSFSRRRDSEEIERLRGINDDLLNQIVAAAQWDELQTDRERDQRLIRFFRRHASGDGADAAVKYLGDRLDMAHRLEHEKNSRNNERKKLHSEITKLKGQVATLELAAMDTGEEKDRWPWEKSRHGDN